MERYEVIIIGGGPAGLFCAIRTADLGRSVLLLEKNSQCGRKLLISGSGQCNITHAGSLSEFFTHYGDNGSFLKHALRYFSNTDLIAYFAEHHLELWSTEEGKVFPKSQKSQDVLNLLLQECRVHQIPILHQQVRELSSGPDHYLVRTDEATFLTDSLVIATGGASYPVTGSSGDSILLAEMLCQPVTSLSPALTPVYLVSYPFGDLSGISFRDLRLSLYRDNRKIREYSGDLLFTHTGLSGPGILNFSRFIAPGDDLRISFIPGKKMETINQELIVETAHHGTRLVRSALLEYALPERFIRKMLDLVGIAHDCTLAHLSKKLRGDLLREFTDYSGIVSHLGGFDRAMATKGGVALEGIEPKTMESKISPGLFCIGEALDIDGDTGGYNLQAAFSTAALAAHRIGRR